MMTCSWEGWHNYSNPAYTGDRTFLVWPTGYAVLLGGDQPAIPSAIPAAADENTDPAGEFLRGVATAPVGGNSPRERGSAAMTLEQALEKIKELEAKIAELEKAADKVKDSDPESAPETAAAMERATAAEGKLTAANAELAKYRAAEAEALRVKCADLAKTVTEKVLPARREGLTAKLAAMDSDAVRVQFLEIMAENLDGLQADPAKLAEGDPESDGSDPFESKVKAAEKLAADKGIGFAQAYAEVTTKEE